MRRTILMATVLVLTASVAGGAAPASDTGPTADRPAGDLLEQVRENRRRLMRSNAAAPPTSDGSKDLDDAVRRLQEAVRRPIVRRQPTEAPVPETAAEPAAAAPAPAPQRPTLSAEQLRLIREHPLKDLGDPMALADTLFLGGHLAEACTLYERLLTEASLSASDQAWCLFQAAGCKRPTDPAGALTLYERLLAQHPESLWTEAAKARQAVLQWRKTTQPQALLSAVKLADPNAPAEGTAP